MVYRGQCPGGEGYRPGGSLLPRYDGVVDMLKDYDPGMEPYPTRELLASRTPANPGKIQPRPRIRKPATYVQLQNVGDETRNPPGRHHCTRSWVSTPCGAVSPRGITCFVPYTLEL